MKVSELRSAKDQHITHIEVSKIFDRIRSCQLQIRIDELRRETDKDRKRSLKEALPAVIFAGVFDKRGDDNLKLHSGLAVLDIDHIGTTDLVEAEKEKLKLLPFVYAAFVSPSGDGLKVVVKIPPCHQTEHRKYYGALMLKFPQVDTTSQNPERICFLSCDKNIYVNYDAVEFTEMVDVAEKKKSTSPANVKLAPVDNYAFAERALKMIRNSQDGRKHIDTLKASRLMGGLIAGGVISESEGIRLLEKEVSNKPNVINFDGAKKTIRAGIEYGKKTPITLEREFEVAKIDIVSDIDEVWEMMKYSFVHGKKRGSTTHFTNFDKNFTWKEKDITLIIGSGNAGKTEFATQLMLMKSHFDDWKWAVFTPENYPEDEFYDTLIHAYIGKTTDPHYKDQQMSMEEYEKGYRFIRSHFFYVYPDEESHNIEEVESHFSFYIETQNINGVLLDPFNQLDIDFSIRDDQFLSKFLKERKNFAKKYNIHYVITSHPKTMQRDKNTGEYPVVNLYDIAGGAMWNNKIDNLLSVHRPNRMKDPKDTSVEIHTLKIKKQKLVGIPGICSFDYKRITNRYYQDGINPLESSHNFEKEPKQFHEPKIIESDESPF
jgi:VirE N-terminal domain/DnaB-like helicase C terminal domain